MSLCKVLICVPKNNSNFQNSCAHSLDKENVHFSISRGPAVPGASISSLGRNSGPNQKGVRSGKFLAQNLRARAPWQAARPASPACGRTPRRLPRAAPHFHSSPPLPRLGVHTWLLTPQDGPEAPLAFPQQTCSYPCPTTRWRPRVRPGSAPAAAGSELGEGVSPNLRLLAGRERREASAWGASVCPVLGGRGSAGKQGGGRGREK